jgi:hypothetical protein
MLLLLQAGILVLSIYMIAKGVEIKLKAGRNPESDRPGNRVLALVLVVVGLGAGFGCLYWMGALQTIRH